MANLLFLIKIKMTKVGISETDLAELIFSHVNDVKLWLQLEQVSKKFNQVSKRKLIKKEKTVYGNKHIWTELPSDPANSAGNSAGSNGIKHGTYKKLNIDGKITYEFNFSNNLYHGLCKLWHLDGHISTEHNYSHGKSHGLCKSWYSNEYLVHHHKWADMRGVELCKPLPPTEYSYCLNYYVNDRRYESKGYYSNDQLMYHFNSPNGIKEGSYKWWDHTGKLVIDEYYVNDQLKN